MELVLVRAAGRGAWSRDNRPMLRPDSDRAESVRTRFRSQERPKSSPCPMTRRSAASAVGGHVSRETDPGSRPMSVGSFPVLKVRLLDVPLDRQSWIFPNGPHAAQGTPLRASFSAAPQLRPLTFFAAWLQQLLNEECQRACHGWRFPCFT